jgi:hypothetical protein
MATPQSQVVTGGRAVVSITDANGNTQVIGIFESAQVSESLSVEDVHILGRFGPVEIVVTAANSVKVNCSGFRVYGFGVKTLGKYPTLQQLLNLGPITLTVGDRSNPTGNALQTIIGCIPDSNSNNYNSKSTSRINISYTGTAVTDETNPGDAEVGAVSLP